MNLTLLLMPELTGNVSNQTARKRASLPESTELSGQSLLNFQAWERGFDDFFARRPNQANRVGRMSRHYQEGWRAARMLNGWGVPLDEAP